MGKIGIRREDALIYERRCPLIPSHVGELVKQGFGRKFSGPGLGPGPTVLDRFRVDHRLAFELESETINVFPIKVMRSLLNLHPKEHSRTLNLKRKEQK